MVKRYIQWYLDHLNLPDYNGINGTVYDYDYDPVTCTGIYQPDPRTGIAPKYDATHAYAGTFLSLFGTTLRLTRPIAPSCGPSALPVILSSSPTRSLLRDSSTDSHQPPPPTPPSTCWTTSKPNAACRTTLGC